MSEAVELLPYDPKWALDYAAEQANLLGCFVEPPLRIEHFGSTAVPGLSAKPIIDVLVVVKDMDTARVLLPAVEALGYVSAPNYPDPHRIVLIKRNTKGDRTHHLHFHADTEETRRHLVFRDALRADPAVLGAYERLKQDLAVRFRDDRDAYSRHKTAFIDEVVFANGGPARKTSWNP